MQRVLLVDDDGRRSAALAGSIEQLGYAIETAGSVDAAIATCAARPFDLMLLVSGDGDEARCIALKAGGTSTVRTLDQSIDVVQALKDVLRVVEDGVPAGTLRALVKDLDACRSNEDLADRLRRLQKQLIQAEKLSSLGQLAAGIAHEINNPLTAIMGFAELVTKRNDLDTDRIMGKIVENAERIKKILLDLKDFYVPALNKKARVQINQIVRNAVPIVRVHPEGRNVNFESELSPDAGWIYADENQILQVIINLFFNAFHAMPDGGEITVSTRQDGDMVVLCVRDTGCGIEPDKIDRIFDPFFTTKSDWKGTGLGLSVCYSIIDSHSGEITVESEVGVGSRFSVRLPRVDPPAAETSSPVVAKGEAGGKKIAEARILIVDDEPDCRSLLRRVVEMEGATADEADGGASALALCRKKPYDVVMLDYRMPGMRGDETFHAIRKILPSIKVIVVTGSIGEHAAELVGVGANAFLRKPFHPQDVIEQLRRVLSGAAPRGLRGS